MTDTAVGFESVAIVVTSSVSDAIYGTDTVLTSAQLALLEQVIGTDQVVLVPEFVPGTIYTGRVRVVAGRGPMASGRGSPFTSRGAILTSRGPVVE